MYNKIPTLFILLIFILNISKIRCQKQYCQHPIFCNEKILSAVSDSQIFQVDFKSFVDLVLKVPVQKALQSFQQDSLKNFIQKNFISSDIILKPVNLTDYVEKPSKFARIKDYELQNFAYDLNSRWNQLARKVNLNFIEANSTCVSDCSTFLEIMNNKTIIIPGGRFRQGYYWDSYWILKGLIASDMLISAQNIVRNFLQIVKVHGYVPNGFRQYYLDRSQPPFLTLMVKQVTEALLQKNQKQKADQLQSDSFMLLVKEHNFWQTYRSRDIKVKNNNFKINFYSANTTTPRPESYQQDLLEVQNITDPRERTRLFNCFSAMAESGWDFSSRWFKDSNQLLSSIMNEIVPTDLNTLLAVNQAYLAKLAQKYQRMDLQTYFVKRVKERQQYFAQIRTNEGLYPDYRPYNSSSVYPSDFYPYLLQAQQLNFNIDKIYNSTVNPTSSFIFNKQQWDSPNVWAPHNWILHEILPHQKAFQFAQQWVDTVYCSWKKSGVIYQKYRMDKLGQRGEGGQYQVQTGFGWTNGLVMYYLMLYPDQLTAPLLKICG